MSRVFITESYLSDIATAIRAQVPGTGRMYPRQMPTYIGQIGAVSLFIRNMLNKNVDSPNVYLLSRVTKIRSYCFSNQTNLAGNLNLPNVVTVGEYAFRNCTGITSVTFSDKIRVIAANAFSGCNNITINLNVAEDFVSGAPWGATNATINWTGTLQASIIHRMIDKSIDGIPVNVSSAVTSIRSYAFSGCTALAGELNFPLVQTIGDYAFKNCTAITGIELGEDIVTISSTAFSGCTGITDITIPLTSGAVSGSPWGATNAVINWTG